MGAGWGGPVAWSRRHARATVPVHMRPGQQRVLPATAAPAPAAGGDRGAPHRGRHGALLRARGAGVRCAVGILHAALPRPGQDASCSTAGQTFLEHLPLPTPPNAPPLQRPSTPCCWPSRCGSACGPTPSCRRGSCRASARRSRSGWRRPACTSCGTLHASSRGASRPWRSAITPLVRALGGQTWPVLLHAGLPRSPVLTDTACAPETAGNEVHAELAKLMPPAIKLSCEPVAWLPGGLVELEVTGEGW